jgi:hypothetical protein
VIVDLRCKQPGLIDGALDGSGLVVLPLTPQTNSHESREGDDGCENQSQ